MSKRYTSREKKIQHFQILYSLLVVIGKYFIRATVENIFPIDKNGMRVLIEGKGGFSLYWDKIAKIGDFEHVFVGLNVLEYYLSLYEGTVEDLLDFSKNGYLRVLYK